MNPDLWLFELIPLAEEIKHGKVTPEKAKRMAELILMLNEHLFDGGRLPQAWFTPSAADFGDPTNDLIMIDMDEPFSEMRLIQSIPCPPPEEDFDFSCFDETASK